MQVANSITTDNTQLEILKSLCQIQQDIGLCRYTLSGPRRHISSSHDRYILSSPSAKILDNQP